MIKKLTEIMIQEQNKFVKNLQFVDIHIASIVSSVSARKLKCPSSARLDSETSQLGLARAGKFQLELISNM